MSQPSNAARQAALLEQQEHSRPDPHPVGYHVQQAIDAANRTAPAADFHQTAKQLVDDKLREVLRPPAADTSDPCTCSYELDPNCPKCSAADTSAAGEETVKQIATDITMLVLNNQFTTPKCHEIIANGLAALREQLELTNGLLGEQAKYESIRNGDLVHKLAQAQAEIERKDREYRHIIQRVNDDYIRQIQQLEAALKQMRAVIASLRNPERSTPETINKIIDRALEEIQSDTAALDAVIAAETAKLREQVSDNDSFMAFMTGELAKFECCHEKGKHVGTPPMMWPELIACIAKKAAQDAMQQQSGEKP